MGPAHRDYRRPAFTKDPSMLRVSSRAFFLPACLCGAATWAAGQPGGAALDEVIISSSLETTLPQQLSRYGNDVATLSAEEIKAGGYRDVAQALERSIPGLYISPSYGPFSYTDISLQGSRTGDVLWVVDGVRVNNRLYNTTSPNDTIPSSMVERIEVLKDGQGLYYGTQAVAGVINIVTKSFSDTTDGNLSVGGDSNDGYNANAYLRGALGEHKLVGYASYDRSAGYAGFDIFQPSTTDRERGYRVATLGGKYGYVFSDSLALSAGWQHTDAKVEQSAPARIFSSANTRDEDVVSARLDYTPTGAFQFFLKGYLHDWDSHINTVRNSVTQPFTQTTISDNAFWGYQDYGLNALAKLSLVSTFDTFIGYDYQNYNGRDEELLIEGTTQRVHALFTQLRSTDALSAKAHFAVGARYNRGGEGQSTTVWNASARYDVNPALYVQGVAGTAFRLPDTYELYAIDPFDTRGNPDLVGEKSRNFNLTVGGLLPAAAGLQWSVTGFHRKVKNLIDVVDDGSDNGVFANTADVVTAKGVDIDVQAQLGPDWRTQASYTWTQSRTEGSNLQRDRTPESYIKAGLHYAPAEGAFSAGASLYWLGKRFQTVPTFGRLESGDYALLDLSAKLAFGTARAQSVNVRLENALDEDYQTGLGRSNVDATGAFYLYRRLGVPRTLHLTYSHDF
jgi:outer membrane cobalamin receptor